MKLARKRRRGFTLVEMIIVVIILAIVTIACVVVSRAVESQRVMSRNSIYLTTHNLNVMESLRREMNSLGITGELFPYYGFQDNEEEYNLYPEDVRTKLEGLFLSRAAAIEKLNPTVPLTTVERQSIEGVGLNPDDVIFRPDYSTEDIRTEVFIEITPWDNFHLYNVRIESKLKGYNARVINTYVMTDIGIDKNPVIPTTT